MTRHEILDIPGKRRKMLSVWTVERQSIDKEVGAK
jgi:hypothetical protein